LPENLGEIALTLLERLGTMQDPDDIITALNEYLFREMNVSYIGAEELRAIF